jgi:type IV pilus assembly protein PilC
VNLVDAGEKSGALEGLLEKIATYKEKTEALKSKIKKALGYPIAVVCVAVIVTAILLLFVVPQFEELFKGFGAALPAFTQFVVDLSRSLQANWWIYLIVMVGAGTAIKMLFARSEKARDLKDEYMLKLPVVGDIMMKAAIARFTRTLETMFAAGVPLVEAMDSVAGATGNAVYEKATYEVRDEIATGQPLQVAMTQTGVFPNLAVQMIAIGEESGALDQMAGKVAEFYEQEVDDAVDGLTSLLEPLIMAVLGVLVGGLIIAMYLPIFKLGAVVG